MSTTEPIDEDGNTLNPTKSPCDRYVFNTVLTRAKSLVVVVGSPRILLNTEQHMVKLYGDKGRCWSLYLKSCLEHGTLVIPSLVEPDQSIAQRFKEQLAAHLGATLPNDQIFQSSRANYRTRGTNLVTVSNMHAKNGSKLVAHPAQSRLSDSQHVAIQAKSGMRLVHKPLSSDENVLKQISQVEYTTPMNLQTTTSSYSQLAVQNKPAMHPVGFAQKLRAATVEPKSESVNQLLNSKSAAKQTIQETRTASAGAVSNSEQTVDASHSQPIKMTSSTIFSDRQKFNTETNPKSESRVASQQTPPQQKTISSKILFDTTRPQTSTPGMVTQFPSNQMSAPMPTNSKRASTYNYCQVYHCTFFLFSRKENLF